MRIWAVAWLVLIGTAKAVFPGEIKLSDPANTPAPPSWAIGFAHREADFDVLPGFRKPPPGYGEVGFFWWLGDPLTKGRLSWELDQLAGKGVMGLQINYAHSDKGGRSYGLTYPSQPGLFTEDWWGLVGWFMQEAKQRGMAVSLSDYTLGVGQGWCVDEVIKENPSLRGAVLGHQARTRAGGTELRWRLPDNRLSVMAYRTTNGVVVPDSGVDLSGSVKGGELVWAAPEGQWQVVEVHFEEKPWSIDPLNRQAGNKFIEQFFQRFEEHNPGEGGKGLNFFFSDELDFGVSGNLWTADLAGVFKQRKGYDLLRELPALFVDIGPRTPKIRLDYRDVMVGLTEEGFFKPVFDWHQQRGMIYGCDHGGRGYDVLEFGDYFRAMRWYQGPGNDQPHLGSAIVRTKVSSSIAHLYERPRCWLEGFYGSGWGTTPAQVADATFRNFVHGQNLLTLHGLYYSTHGGWWEWAPPCNHFHMPYWRHMGQFLHCVERLSYLLSQGVHRCDVAILYPVAPSEAGLGGEAAKNSAFALADRLASNGIDFDFIDFESVARARVENRELRVSGEAYRVLVLPAMKAVRLSTLEKAREFQQAGGRVVATEALPEASDRAGREDKELDKLVQELFSAGPMKSEEVASLVEPRDYRGPGEVLHRVIGHRNVYFVYGAPKRAECFFRATGKVELWDPWTGESKPLPVISQDGGGTRLHAPLEANEPQLIVFSSGTAELEPTRATQPEPAGVITLDDDWEFELQPSLDNRYGDYHWPPTPGCIGPEARRLRYAEETEPNCAWQDPELDDSAWRAVTCGFGPRFWRLGPLPEGVVGEQELAGLREVYPEVAVELGGQKYFWQPYEFSWRFGMEDDDAHQGYHGLKEQVADEFIGLGRIRHDMPATKREAEQGGKRYYLWTSIHAAKAGQVSVLQGGLLPAGAWLNGTRLDPQAREVSVRAGANPLLLRYDQPGRGYFVFRDGPPARVAEGAKELPWNRELAMRWYRDEQILPFDTRPQTAQPVGWYRFKSPPGLRRMAIICPGGLRAWVNGQEVVLKPGARKDEQVGIISNSGSDCASVALRVEQERGNYGGAAFSDYIRLECGSGKLSPGDWAKTGVLETYSGGAWYRKRVDLPAAIRKQRVTLDLGNVVATAEVRVNGRDAGIRVAPPWTLDVTEFVRPGENRIEVLVYNTLANHYVTIPTHYRGQTTAGLLGPVALKLDGR